MKFHRLSLHRPRYIMLLKYLTIFHPDILNHRCQATNLAGSSEQITPVTVRHAGESNVQCPKCDFNFNLFQSAISIVQKFEGLVHSSDIAQLWLNYAIWLLWNDCCAFMVSVLQWQRTTRPPVVQSTTTVWTAATALTTSPLASWSAGNAKWSD